MLCWLSDVGTASASNFAISMFPPSWASCLEISGCSVSSGGVMLCWSSSCVSESRAVLNRGIFLDCSSCTWDPLGASRPTIFSNTNHAQGPSQSLRGDGFHHTRFLDIWWHSFHGLICVAAYSICPYHVLLQTGVVAQLFSDIMEEVRHCKMEVSWMEVRTLGIYHPDNQDNSVLHYHDYY